MKRILSAWTLLLILVRWTHAAEITSKKIAHFIIPQETHITTLLSLSQLNIPMGVEIQLTEQSQAFGSPMELNNTTVARILDRVCADTHLYEWEEANGVIHIFPIGKPVLSGCYLDRKVPNLSYTSNTHEEIISGIFHAWEKQDSKMRLSVDAAGRIVVRRGNDTLEIHKWHPRGLSTKDNPQVLGRHNLSFVDKTFREVLDDLARQDTAQWECLQAGNDYMLDLNISKHRHLMDEQKNDVKMK